jgi:hypothetical protein
MNYAVSCKIARWGQSLPKGSVVRHSKIDRQMQRWVDAVEKVSEKKLWN